MLTTSCTASPQRSCDRLPGDALEGLLDKALDKASDLASEGLRCGRAVVVPLWHLAARCVRYTLSSRSGHPDR